MGARNFIDAAIGRTVDDAYATACRRAEYQFGHDPYNGTISTTSGVRLVKLPGKCTPAAIRRWKLAALERTEKWGHCEAIELPRSHAKGAPRGHRKYLFCGWAAS